ncbi:MAG: hypothetical protein ACRC80_14820, partial [Waterburya sp.]
MTTFLLFIFGLWGSRYFRKYFFDSHQVDSTSNINKQKKPEDVAKVDAATTSSVGNGVAFVLKSIDHKSNINSTKTANNTKSVIKNLQRNYQLEVQSYDCTRDLEYYYTDYPELKQLKLYPCKTNIQSGESVQFKLTGLDQFNNKIKISDRVSWSATAGTIDYKGLFSIDSKNDVLVTITAKVGTIKTTSIVNV